MSEVKLTIIDPRVDLTICDDDVAVHITDSGPQGPQGPQGIQGEQGARGSQVLSGTVDPSPIIGLLGDQYINTATGYIFGPKNEGGWGIGTLLGSGLIIEEVSYTHYQLVTSQTWIIPNSDHQILFNPNITVVDLDGNVVEGDIKYNNDNITITFSHDIAGAAYLS